MVIEKKREHHLSVETDNISFVCISCHRTQAYVDSNRNVAFPSVAQTRLFPFEMHGYKYFDSSNVHSHAPLSRAIRFTVHLPTPLVAVKAAVSLLPVPQCGVG